MCKYYYLVFLLIWSAIVFGQSQSGLDAKLAKQLEDSRYLKNTMKPYLEDAGITRWQAKEVLKTAHAQ
jgi:hypothetical protein